MGKIGVLLVDDHAILRVGLRAYLHYYDDIEVAGEAQDGNEAIELVAKLHPDVVVMDITMPGMNGIEATRQIRSQYPETHVLILSQHEDPDYVIPLMQAGASGYILKNALGTDLLNALRMVARGETFLGPSIAKIITEEIRHPGKSKVITADALTPREKQILKSIAQGQTNAQIAVALSISINTVEWHRANLMSKLGIHTVADLVRYALQRGLADSND